MVRPERQSRLRPAAWEEYSDAPDRRMETCSRALKAPAVRPKPRLSLGRL